jgi:hypothetical protein
MTLAKVTKTFASSRRLSVCADWMSIARWYILPLLNRNFKGKFDFVGRLAFQRESRAYDST